MATAETITKDGFGARLHEAMVAANIRICKLGELSGVSRWTLNSWLTGKIKSPDLDGVKKVAEVLHTTPEALLYERNGEGPRTMEELLAWRASVEAEFKRHMERLIAEEVVR